MNTPYSAKSRYKGTIAKNYLSKRVEEVKWQREQTIVKGLVDKYMKKGDLILDVPFGTGRFSKYYIDKGLVTYGLDISQDMLDEARKQLGSEATKVRLIKGDAENLSFSDNEVDFIICVRLLNWVPLEVIDRFLSEFTRVAASKLILHIRIKNNSGIMNRTIKMARYNPLLIIKYLSKKYYASFKRLFKLSNSCSEIIIHKKIDIYSLFTKYKLSIDEEIIVEEYDSNIQYISSPLYFYVLSIDNKRKG